MDVKHHVYLGASWPGNVQCSHLQVSSSCSISKDVPLVEFPYLVFSRLPGESYRRRLRSLLLCLCDVLRALINSLVSALGLVLFRLLLSCLLTKSRKGLARNVCHTLVKQSELVHDVTHTGCLAKNTTKQTNKQNHGSTRCYVLATFKRLLLTNRTRVSRFGLVVRL